MARPSRFDTPVLLDAALELAAGGGPAAVTMSAVAHRAGAPSGSVYHRFPDRPTLLAALWLRTLETFQEGLLTALEPPPHDGKSAPGDRSGVPAARECAHAAARHTVAWSRSNPDEARLLRYGAADFGYDSWREPERARLQETNERTRGALSALADRLGATDPVARERVTVAVVDVPYGLVQRHLRAGSQVPRHALTAVEECVAALLPDGG